MPSRLGSTAVLVILGGSWWAVPEVLAQEVPQSAAISGFRGDGSGLNPKSLAPTEWDEKKNVKWHVKVGTAFSSPVVCGDAVFVTSNPSELICVSASKGSINWTASLGSKDVPAELQAAVKSAEGAKTACGMATPTPVCDGKHVFALFGTGVVACFTVDGKREWIVHIAPTENMYGHSSSPLLVDGKLLINLGQLTALDPATGKILWKCAEAAQYFGTPAVLKLSSTVVVTPLGVVVRVSDGKMLAKSIADDLSGDEYGISPTAAGDIAYVGDRTVTAVKMELKGDTLETKRLWSTEMAEGAFASPIVANGLFFYVGKTAIYTILDAATGEKLQENPLKLAPSAGMDKDHSDANVYPSLSMANGKLFIANDVGQTFVLEPTKEYKEVARNVLPAGSGATPAFTTTSLYVRAGDELYCIEK